MNNSIHLRTINTLKTFSIVLMTVSVLLSLYAGRPNVDFNQLAVLYWLQSIAFASFPILITVHQMKIYYVQEDYLKKSWLFIRDFFGQLFMSLFAGFLYLLLARGVGGLGENYLTYLQSSSPIVVFVLIILQISLLNFIVFRFNLLFIFQKKTFLWVSLAISLSYLYTYIRYIPFQQFVNQYFYVNYMANIGFWLFFYCLGNVVVNHFESIISNIGRYLTLINLGGLIAIVASMLIDTLFFPELFPINPLLVILYYIIFFISLNIANTYSDIMPELVDLVDKRWFSICLMVPLLGAVYREELGRLFDYTLLFILVGIVLLLGSAIGITLLVRPTKNV